MRVVEPVDQVQVAGPARARTHRELARRLRLGGRGERRRLLVPHMHPVDAALRGAPGAADRIDHGIEAVADDAVDALDSGVDEGGHELVGDGLRHGGS